MGDGRAVWLRDEMRAHVRGRLVRLYDVVGQDLAVPGWLAEMGNGAVPFDGTEALTALHPDDLLAFANWFVALVAQPGEVTRVPCRFLVDGEWRHTRVDGVNLVDDPGVAGIVVCAEPGDVTDVDVGAGALAGDYDAVDWVLARLGPLGEILHIEGKVVELLGRTADEVTGTSLVGLMHLDSLADGLPNWHRIVLSGPGTTSTARRCLLRPDGSLVWAEFKYLNRLIGDHPDILVMAHDITDQRAQEAALRERTDQVHELAEQSRALAEQSRLLAEEFRLLADEVPAAVFRSDARGRVLFHNARWTELFHHAGEVVRVQDAVFADDRPQVDRMLRAVVQPEGPDALEVEVRSTEGRRVLCVRCRAVPGSGDAPDRIVGSVTDITATVRLRREARHDQLTGLLNRVAIEDKLASALAAHPDGTLVVFIDLDGFKKVNDDFGHEAGDTVLEEVARRLTLGLRPGDAVGRYGGDEFVVVCSDAEGASVAAIVGRLERALAGPIDFGAGTWQPRASLGAARARAGEELASLLHRADMAMFEVKRSRPGAHRDPPGRR